MPSSTAPRSIVPSSTGPTSVPSSTIGLITYSYFWQWHETAARPLSLAEVVAKTASWDVDLLQRCDFPALERYEAHRKPRNSRIQAISSANTWMQQKGEQDTSWLYGYDAWNAPL